MRIPSAVCKERATTQEEKRTAARWAAPKMAEFYRSDSTAAVYRHPGSGKTAP